MPGREKELTARDAIRDIGRELLAPPPQGRPQRPPQSKRLRHVYFGNAEYPRGFVGGIARSEHFFSPHFEQRILFSTSVNFASHPQSLPNVRGSAVRS